MVKTVTKSLERRHSGFWDTRMGYLMSETKQRKCKKTTETVLGVTFRKRKRDRKTWWWNEKVQESTKRKKEAKKAWDKIRDENSKTRYKEKKSKAKKSVAMAKERVYEDFYARLEIKENEKEL